MVAGTVCFGHLISGRSSKDLDATRRFYIVAVQITKDSGDNCQHLSQQSNAFGNQPSNIEIEPRDLATRGFVVG